MGKVRVVCIAAVGKQTADLKLQYRMETVRNVELYACVW